MCLKLAVALAFVALTSGRLLGGNTFFVDVGHQYIKVVNPQGEQVKFIVDQFYGYEGPQTIQVYFYGQDVAPKTVQYYDQQGTYQDRYQSDILYQIFNKYEGQLDEIEYEKILTIISTYVQDGQIHPAILYALQALFGQYEALNFFDKYQGLYQQTPYNKLGFLFGQRYNRFGDYDRYYQKDNQFGVGSYYPRQHGVFGHLFGKQYEYGYPQKYHGSQYGPYSRYAYQYGSDAYTEEYPQQFGGYFGPYSAGKSYQYGSHYPQHYSRGLYEPSYIQQYSRGLYEPSYTQQYSRGFYGPYTQQYIKGFYGPYADNAFQYQRYFQRYGSQY